MKILEKLKLKENTPTKNLILGLCLILALGGIITRIYFISFASIILAIAVNYTNINILYSIFMVLFFFAYSEPVDLLNFRWERLYFFLVGLIIIKALLKENLKEDLEAAIKDKYLKIMVLILVWGTISSLFSIATKVSLKKTLGVFLAYLIFYLIPQYRFTKENKDTIIGYLLYPLSALMTTLGTINIVYAMKILKIKDYIEWWGQNKTIYKNSNFFGYLILMVLILMNLYIFRSQEKKEEIYANKNLKRYFIASYIILGLNMVLSGSRTALLATMVAYSSIIYKYLELILLSFVPLSFYLWIKRDDLYLLMKLGGGTSGRTELWKYGIKEVIAKRPILGVGSGAYTYYMEAFEGMSLHNAYLHEIMINGFPGLGLWFYALYKIFKSALDLRESRRLILATLLSFLVYALFEIGLFGEISLRMSIFWIIIMVIDHYKIEEETKEKQRRREKRNKKR